MPMTAYYQCTSSEHDAITFEFDYLRLQDVLLVQVLGVTRAASRETCIQASEKLLVSVPDVGYSQDLILSRALALEATTSVLLDYTTRRAYDRSPKIEVPYTDMPGASHLLLQHDISLLKACICRDCLSCSCSAAVISLCLWSISS